MATVSHHTRACPGDISGLLISAFPGSHCVVTVTSQLGFFGRAGGQGCRREEKEAPLPKNKVKILPVPGLPCPSGRPPSQRALAKQVLLGPLT